MLNKNLFLVENHLIDVLSILQVPFYLNNLAVFCEQKSVGKTELAFFLYIVYFSLHLT